jgi:uncharacterized protein
MDSLSESLQRKREQLIDRLRSLRRCVVGFSGGIDSSVLARAAREALDEEALAVTAVSASSATGEVAEAEAIAREIGIRHEVLPSEEMEDADYLQNDALRCYHCKRVRFRQIVEYAKSKGFPYVLEGSNADDRQDYRPGTKAVKELEVLSPLAEANLSKPELRELARDWGLPNWDKPATPCLSTRIAYGIPITELLLRRIDRAESLFREQGFPEYRVRCHAEDLARIEVPPSEIERLFDSKLRHHLVRAMKSLGFRFVTIDLEGFRSGSMNAGVENSSSE